MPDTITAREVICWIDAVIGHPVCYTAGRLGIARSTVGYTRASLARKLGYSRTDVATLVRAAYAVIRDR